MNAKLLRSLRDEPVKYARMVGFTKLRDLHNEWIREMVLGTDDYTLLGHRGSYKTTCLSFAFALLIVLKPNKTIFFMRKTDDDVTEIVRQATKILETDTFKYIAKELYGIDLKLTAATAYKIDTNLNNSSRGQVQLQGMGLNSSITGKHADYVFTDDIVNLKDRTSKAEREQTKKRYQELQNIKNRGGRIFNTGTPWHKEDAISGKDENGNDIMPNKHYFSVYDTGLISDDERAALRASMSPSMFAANYELKHIAETAALFTDVNYLEDKAEHDLIFDGVAHLDAAYGGSDYTAYTIMNELKDGRIIAFGTMWQKHVDMCLAEIMVLHGKYRAGSIQCETNGDKGYLAAELEKNGFFVNTYAERTNKFIKIATFLKKNWARIFWLPETNPEYINQIMSYTEFAEHDDAPDSAASLVRFICDKPTIVTDDILRGGII